MGSPRIKGCQLALLSALCVLPWGTSDRQRCLKIPAAAGSECTGELPALSVTGSAEPVVSKEGTFCHVFLVRSEPSAGLLLHVGNTGVIIKFVL